MIDTGFGADDQADDDDELFYDEDDDEDEFLYNDWSYSAAGEEDDGESVLETLARLAVEIEAGRAEPYYGWALDRSHPGVLVWTTPSGLRYASTLSGEPVPLP